MVVKYVNMNESDKKDRKKHKKSKEIRDHKDRVICRKHVVGKCKDDNCHHSHYLKHYPCKQKLAYSKCNKSNCEYTIIY